MATETEALMAAMKTDAGFVKQSARCQWLSFFSLIGLGAISWNVFQQGWWGIGFIFLMSFHCSVGAQKVLADAMRPVFTLFYEIAKEIDG